LWAHAWWLLVGAILGLGTASILTIGIFVLPFGIALGVVGALVPKLRNRSVLAVVAGAAPPLLYVAWLNRSGPGTVCDSTGETCTDEWSPWPFVVLATLFLAAPFVGARLARAAK
jgi:hypothetical protein